MTNIEKLRKDCSGLSEDIIDKLIENHCPSDFSYKDFYDCCIDSKCEPECDKCWNTETDVGSEINLESEDSGSSQIESYLRLDNYKLNDLKNGMICTLRCGVKYVYMYNTLLYYTSDTICNINNIYSEDLKSKQGAECDIVKISIACVDNFYDIFDDKCEEIVLWQAKEMTLEDIERELGYPIVIKEDSKE